MPSSTLTSKSQLTVPREVREHLEVGPGSQLEWELRDGEARVRPKSFALERWRGRFNVGRGSVVDDVKLARKLRGRIGW